MITPAPPPPAARPRPRWARLSLRATMALVLLVGGGMGWVMHRVRTQRAAVAVLKAAKQIFRYDWQMDEVGIVNGQRVNRTEPAAPRWLRRVVGDEPFQHVKLLTLVSPVTPEVLAAAAACDRVEDLGLVDVAPPSDWPRLIRGLPRLRALSLPAPLASDSVLAQVARVESLRRLSIFRNTGVVGEAPATDAGLAGLVSLRDLEDLTIHDCPGVTDAGMARLVSGPLGLRRLVLRNRPSSVAATLRALAEHHPGLLSLDLTRSDVTDEDLREVGRLKHLQYLHLHCNKRITDAGLAHLRGLRRLEVLSVGSTGITDAGLAHLDGMPQLRQLFLTGDRITDAGVARLVPLTNLRFLSLGLTQVTDAAMPDVARLANLEDLWLMALPGLTDAGLAPLKALTKLRRLDVSETGVTAGGVAALRAALPGLGRVANQPLPPTVKTGCSS